jgi:hypothetical protein
VRVIWGLAEIVGFQFLAEAEDDQPRSASRRFGHLSLEDMRARMAAHEEEAPPGMRRTSLPELAELAAARRRTLTEEATPEPAVVPHFYSTATRAAGAGGPVRTA